MRARQFTSAVALALVLVESIKFGAGQRTGVVAFASIQIKVPPLIIVASCIAKGFTLAGVQIKVPPLVIVTFDVTKRITFAGV